jgi:PadR family transcriptional regulator PadR
MTKKFRKELNAGTVSLVILSILDQADAAMYGYQIAKSLEGTGKQSEAVVKQGTLYPVLRSLERIGLLESEVEPSVSGPPRRYYSITAEGRESLTQWKEIWRQTRDFVDAVLEEDKKEEKDG